MSNRLVSLLNHLTPSALTLTTTATMTTTTTMSIPSPTLNILMLHGYTQSGALFHAKTRALEKYLQKTFPGCTLSYPTAPIRLRLRDIPGVDVSLLEGGGLQNGEDEDSSEAYSWWRKDDATGEYRGIEESWTFLSSYLDEHGPFHGAIGFSQGAALSAMLASMLETSRREQRPKELATSHPPLRWSVGYSGFRAPNPELAYLYSPKIQTPTLNIIGTLDTVVSEERVMALVECCEGARTVSHPGGHYVVIQKQYLSALGGFIREHMTESKQMAEKEESVEDMDVPF